MLLEFDVAKDVPVPEPLLNQANPFGLGFTKSRESLIEDTLEFFRVLGGEEDVANNTLLFVQYDVLLKIHRVHFQADGQAILQV